MASLYPRIVGERWRELPERLRTLFEVTSERRCSGRFRVRRGEGALARWLARWGGLPRAVESVDLDLTVTADAGGETWSRRFGFDELVTRQWEERGLLVERVGALEFRFQLSVSNGRLSFQQKGARLSAFALRIPLPRWFAPRVSAGSWDEGRVQVSVEICFPGVGLVCGYEGSLDRMDASP
jgi:hypothetical protein